ncbi:TIGR02996 domain-containing protein [Sorangium sp. So ce1014]|uniref:TIGR02996 domain-containing protein n=1 Tax=Sorangium sp. So ce1014 TaxID=3133326 RepID=UPI003F634DD9
MATEADLLRDVLAAPDADAPRLAYAAWCDDQDDPAVEARGSFIRAQIALLATDEAAEPDRRFRLSCEARDLEEAHRAAWITPLSPPARDPVLDRGFVELVTLDARAFLQHAGALLALAPIRHFTIAALGDAAEELFASPHLARVRSLRLDRVGLTDDDVERLAASPHLAELRWLWIGNNRVTRRGAEALAASRRLPALGYVGFVNNPFDPSERQGHDQGLIVDRWLPPEGRALEAKFGALRWLRTEARTLIEVVPDRLRMPG